MCALGDASRSRARVLEQSLRMQPVRPYATRRNFGSPCGPLSPVNCHLSPLAFLAYLVPNLRLVLHPFEPFQLFQQSCMFVFSRYDS